MTGHLKPREELSRAVGLRLSLDQPLFLTFGQATGRIGDAHEANVYIFFAWAISACPSHRDAAANADAGRARRWCSLASGRNLLQSARGRRRTDYRRGNPDFTAGARLSANAWNLYTGAGCRLANNHQATKKRGAVIFIQLWHVGRISHSSLQ